MNTVFSTAPLHPRDRFDRYHSVACRIINDHDAKPEARSSFEAELQSGALGDIGFVLAANSAVNVVHALRHATHANPDELFICRQVAGVLVVEQHSRDVRLQEGDITLLEPRLPYTGRFPSSSKHLILKIPRRALEARVGNLRDMVVRCLKPADSADAGLTSALLAMLPTYVGRLGPIVEAAVQDQVLDLMAVALTTAMREQRPRISSARSLALMQIRAAIEARLADPTLDARKAAAAAGISVRYANAVLAQQGSSIVDLIQTRRLERCRKALDDPSQAHRTISEIAYGWGFSDMTHFGRRFRAAYGLLPSEYRRRENRG